MSTIAAVAATITTVVTAATSAASREMGHHVFNLLGASLTVFEYDTLEMEGLSSQRMVQVYLHLLLANFYDAAVETASFLVLQGNNSIVIDVLMVEMTIDAEYLPVKVEY